MEGTGDCASAVTYAGNVSLGCAFFFQSPYIQISDFTGRSRISSTCLRRSMHFPSRAGNSVTGSMEPPLIQECRQARISYPAKPEPSGDLLPREIVRRGSMNVRRRP